MDVPAIAMEAFACLGVGYACASIGSRRRASRRLAASKGAPVDIATGLLTPGAFRIRAEAELRRAERDGATVALTVVTVLDGDPDAFGQHVNDRLRFPDAGFRLADNLVCIVSPRAGTQPKAATLYVDDAPGVHRLATSHSGSDGASVDQLLRAAVGRLRDAD